MISSAMNNARLDSLIRECGELQDCRPGYWRFEYRDHAVIVMTDELHNRMRIITPVVEVTEVNESVWLMALSANFDRALDARYAINGDYLWSAFIHPLSQLTDAQFTDGLDQVVNLAENFGTTFASTDIAFGSE